MEPPPTLQVFTNYGNERLRLIGEDPRDYTEWVTNKFFDWDAANWHTRPNDPKKTRKILNWKSTFGQCLRYREKNKTKEINVQSPEHVTAESKFLSQFNGITKN